ncbi:response regulator [Lysobacter niastensis]|uniref:Response regulator n=1 Tax=Lysobacter niastensis TaxID=380629 RepID=A0ABS0B9A8_9GAMM|nr:response regulator [Lysobacter niastensis]MBF6024843.1 response regulator [Lysobacter niastensis]
MLAREAFSTEAQPHVLVVDDDEEIGRLLTRYLGGHGYRVSHVGDADGLRRILQHERIDLILLDLGLPDADGLSLLRGFQQHWHGPVIVVSGRGEPVERVVGLELGADDYISKPFDLRELLARVRSVLRRSHPNGVAEAPRLEFDGLRLDVAARHLTGRDGQDVALTTGEFELLRFLLEHPNQVLSRDQIMNHLHGRDVGPLDRAIDAQIGRLRRKIERDPGQPRLIQSVRGAGYLFAAPIHAG